MPRFDFHCSLGLGLRSDFRTRSHLWTTRHPRLAARFRRAYDRWRCAGPTHRSGLLSSAPGSYRTRGHYRSFRFDLGNRSDNRDLFFGFFLSFPNHTIRPPSNPFTFIIGPRLHIIPPLIKGPHTRNQPSVTVIFRNAATTAGTKKQRCE